ncbi:alpha/beta hydrolase family protein [Gimesia panareensis]|uniref:Acetyl esterase n=1 Tax=Gimesia panareensis TaxID=2527978 RepID=A0A517Q6C6_9PLAN|nr:alpha/beta hydrolase [Gimesia panareensis]QDT27191.1 acetyl esterase [Gimesia panareensis]QDU49960.1 acetyl esterase [Gimesia panareensis]
MPQTRCSIFSSCFLTICTFVLLVQSVPAAEDKPQPDERLQKLLKRFPDADKNKDGILTREEAREYRQQLQKRQNRNARPANAVKPTFADVKYGDHARNVLDFYQAQSDQPTPLVIYIHGGGFVGGNKRVNPGFLKQCLDAGISVAGIHYRFIDGKDVLLPEPQRDGARAVQFLRSKAKEWNIDPKRVACFGGSAGAGISMWIGFHDDLANPDSDDPVERESTRIQAIGTFGGQSTYDPIKIKALVGGRAWEHPSIFKAYGVTTAEEALHPTPEQQKRYDESSAITHLTKDDPPLYMVYSEADGPLPANARPGQGIHHPNFGRDLVKNMNELGIENVFIYTPDAKGRNPQREMLEFFQKQFAKVK